MKKILLYFTILGALITSCSKDAASVDEPYRQFELVLSTTAIEANGTKPDSFYEIEVVSNKYVKWEISSVPEWVAPVYMSGDGATNIKLAVDSSRETAVRSDFVRVDAFLAGTLFQTIDYPIKQKGAGLCIEVDGEVGATPENPIIFEFDATLADMDASESSLNKYLYTNVDWKAEVYASHTLPGTTTPDWIKVACTNPDVMVDRLTRDIELTKLSKNTQNYERLAHIVITPLEGEATEETTAILYIKQLKEEIVAGDYMSLNISGMTGYLPVGKGVLTLSNGIVDRNINVVVSDDSINTLITLDAAEANIADGNYTIVKYVTSDSIEKRLVGSVTVSDGVAKINESWEPNFMQLYSDTYPIAISTAAELKILANQVNNKSKSYAGVYFRQTDSFSLENYQSEKGWVPIGKFLASPFSGVYDGNNKSISGLVINNDEMNSGLFGYLKGSVGYPCSVSNITLLADNNAKITDSSTKGYVGSIAVMAAEYASIENCVNYVPINAGGYCGGIVAFVGNIAMKNSDGFIDVEQSKADVNNDNVRVVNCHNMAVLILDDTFSTSLYNAGGVAAVNGGLIENCSNQGAIEAKAVVRVGGVVGISTCRVEKCYNSGNIGVDGALGNSCGGVVGFLSGLDGSEATIANCYNSGDMSKKQQTIGGIIGSMSSSGYTASLINCYNVGSNNGKESGKNDKSGGAIGTWHTPLKDIFGCFYLDETGWTGAIVKSTTGTTYLKEKAAEDAKYEGLIIKEYVRVSTDAELKSAATYTTNTMNGTLTADWDTSIWTIVDGEYPTLKGE